MEIINKSANAIVISCSGNPVSTTMLIILFYAMFNFIEASIERLIFGDRFEHWLDPIFNCAFIIYAGYAVWKCAVYQIERAA